MASHDPRLLYSVAGIRAFHIQQGDESALTPSGPQTLSLLMVPTNSPFADLGSARTQNEAPEEDFYLHLHLPPELDLPLPATTQIYHKPPRSYLIPRWDLGPDSGAFTRIEFPPLGTGPDRVTQEDIDTFETILAQCTAFLERAAAPRAEQGTKPYNPADYAPGEGYAGSEHKPGQIVLIDEDDGSVVGELAEGATVVEDPHLKPGSKNPVEIAVSPDGSKISVRPVSEDYLRMARHPAYKDSTLVQNAAAASRLIVTGSSFLSNAMVSGADTFSRKTAPNETPMTFKPATHERVRKINTLTTSVAGLSARTVGQATKYAQNIGASLTNRKARSRDGGSGSGDEHKPGLLNKSMIAFSTIADGIEQSGKSLLSSGGASVSTMVGHRYGADAGAIATDLAGGVKNVGLVYIDVTGVSRRAVLKSVAKGMVVGRVKGGGEVVVAGGNGGVLNPADVHSGGAQNLGQGGPGQAAMPGGPLGFGNAAPPSYSGGVGEPLTGQFAPEKRGGGPGKS